eukprot:1102946-Rhodomonas_salina.1
MTAHLSILVDHLAIVLQPAAHDETLTSIFNFETTLHASLSSLSVDSKTSDSILITFYKLCKTFNNFSTNDINLDLPDVDITVAEPGIWRTTSSYHFLVSNDVGTLTEKLLTVIRSADENTSQDCNPP